MIGTAPPETLGQRLRRLRDDRELSIADVIQIVALEPALVADVTQMTVEQLEDGTITELTFQAGLALAYAFNVRMRYLIDGVGTEDTFDGDQLKRA